MYFSSFKRFNYIPFKFSSLSQKMDQIGLTFKTAINAYRYTNQFFKSDHLSLLGELTGYTALNQIHQKMMQLIKKTFISQNPTGQRILLEKPRINSETWDLKQLQQLNHNSFGYNYSRFMLDRDFSSDDRPKVQYIPDPELAYVYQRYKEIHDFIHVLMFKDVTVHEEIVVKWYEMASLGLPSTTLSATFGMLKLNCEQTQNLLKHLRMIMNAAHQGEFIMNVYFEEEKQTDIVSMDKNNKFQDSLRKRLRLFPLK